MAALGIRQIGDLLAPDELASHGPTESDRAHSKQPKLSLPKCAGFRDRGGGNRGKLGAVTSAVILWTTLSSTLMSPVLLGTNRPDIAKRLGEGMVTLNGPSAQIFRGSLQLWHSGKLDRVSVSPNFLQRMARPGRFEHPTFWFVARRSIQLS